MKTMIQAAITASMCLLILTSKVGYARPLSEVEKNVCADEAVDWYEIATARDALVPLDREIANHLYEQPKDSYRPNPPEKENMVWIVYDLTNVSPGRVMELALRACLETFSKARQTTATPDNATKLALQGAASALVVAHTSGVGSRSDSKPILTKKKYQEISVGMTYEQIVAIVGHSGDEVGRGGAGIAIYSWENADGSYMNGAFQNGRLQAKSQADLPE
jgi:hypothetical protein